MEDKEVPKLHGWITPVYAMRMIKDLKDWLKSLGYWECDEIWENDEIKYYRSRYRSI